MQSVKSFFNSISTHSIFVVIALMAGIAFAVLTPPLWGLDELAHFDRSYQLAQGEIIPHKGKKDVYGGYVPRTLYEYGKFSIDDLGHVNAEGVIGRQDFKYPDQYNNLKDKKFSSDKHVSQSTSAYSPIAYPGPVLGVLIGEVFDSSIGRTILLARICSLLIYTVVVYVALRILKSYKLKWLLFVVGLFPACIFQASTVTADSLAIALSLLIVAIFARLSYRKQAKDIPRDLITIMALACLLLPLIKINYIFLSMAFLIVPIRYFKSIAYNKYVKITAGVIILFSTLFWTKISNAAGDAPFTQRPDGLPVSSGDQLQFVIHHPLGFVTAITRTIVNSSDSYLNSLISLTGWNYVMSPFFFTALLLMACVLAALYAKSEIIVLRKQLLLLNALLVLGIVSIYGALYLAFSPVGGRTVDGIQGRYFIPFFIPIVLLIVAYTPIKIVIKETLIPYIFISISSTCLLVSLLYYVLATY